MATPVFVHGAKGTISLNGSLFNALSIDYEETTTNEDITFTTPAGATQRSVIPGYISRTCTLNFVYDTANQPTISPYNLQAGKAVAVIIYPEGSKPYTFTAVGNSLRFTTGPQAGAVKCNWSADGSYWYVDPVTGVPNSVLGSDPVS